MSRFSLPIALFGLAIETVCFAALGVWYLLAVPSSDVTEPASGLPAGGYAPALGIGAIVLGIGLAGAGWLIARGRTWPIGAAVAWQPFQAVIGVSLLGEPGLTAAIGAVAVVMVATSIVSAVALIVLLAARGQRTP